MESNVNLVMGENLYNLWQQFFEHARSNVIDSPILDNTHKKFEVIRSRTSGSWFCFDQLH